MRYGGTFVEVRRIALKQKQLAGLPSFPATDKRADPRYKWFTNNFGNQCWEIDALDPNALRSCVEREIEALIEPVAWQRCEVVNAAEQGSLREYMRSWARLGQARPQNSAHSFRDFRNERLCDIAKNILFTRSMTTEEQHERSTTDNHR
jgi:hypothetical protein